MNTIKAQNYLSDAVKFLGEQEKELRPLITHLQNLILNNMTDELTLKEAFGMYMKLTEQYTNSIILLAKVKEVLDARED